MIRKNNKGYSFVEMIIVLALVVILATLSLVSLTLINNARAKDASNKLGSEFNEVRKKSIEMIPSKSVIENEYGGTYSATKTYKYGIILYEENGKFMTSQVICELDKSDPDNPVYKYLGLGNPAVTNNTTVKYSSKVGVTFKGTYDSLKTGSQVVCSDKTTPGGKDSANAICIMFDKHGNCESGYGEYYFTKKNANQIARVIVKQNGSIVVR